MCKQRNQEFRHIAKDHRSEERSASLLIFLLMIMVGACFSASANDAAQVVIKLDVVASVKNGKLQIAQGSEAADLQEIECIADRHGAVIHNTFSAEPGSLNSSGQLGNYLTISFVNGLNQGVSMSQIIDDLEQLDFVQTAYVSPIGEDAKAPLPEEPLPEEPLPEE